MKIATILPTAHLELEAETDYHMCLAHLMENKTYRSFYAWQAARGAHVIMDNGVVETGEPLSMFQLMRIALQVGVTEMTLPDKLNDRRETLHLHSDALNMLQDYNPEQRVMLIPQGYTRADWVDSVNDMLSLAERFPDQVSAIGISKFQVNGIAHCAAGTMYNDRLQALRAVPQLFTSGVAIHLLGCTDYIDELMYIQDALPGVIRGVDSGLPTFYTMHNQELDRHTARPTGMELDFDAKFTPKAAELLRVNTHRWKHLINSPRRGSGPDDER